MTILTIAGALAGLAAVRIWLWLGSRAVEHRQQRALASFDMQDTRTALTDPPTGVKRAPMFSLKGPTRL